MTRDDFKNLLLADTEDKAGQIDSAVGAYSEALYAVEEAERQLEETKKELDDARATVSSLTETNLKLLEKVKYSEDTGNDNGDTEEEVTAENITIDDLFKEE